MALNKSKVYDDLLSLKINIDFQNIPTPAYIQSLIIKCNDYQRKVERHFIQVTRQLSQVERMLRTEKLSIETKKRQLLINNEKIKKLPTGKEREAAVDEILEEDYSNYLKIENEVCSLKDLLSSIKTVQYNLKSTNSDIKMLVRVMEQQISRLNIGSPDDPEVRELNKNFSDLDKIEEEMTPEDVESSEEYQDSEDEESQDESEEETQEKDTSESDSQSEQESDDESEKETQEKGTSESNSQSEQESDDESGSDSFLMDDFDEDDNEDAESEESEGQPEEDESSSQKMAESDDSSSSSDLEIDIGDDETNAENESAEEKQTSSSETVSENTDEKEVEPEAVQKQKSDAGIDIDELLVSLDEDD